MEENENLTGLNDYRFPKRWDTVRLRVLGGLKKLGHDIPLVGYTAADSVKEMTRRKRSAGISQKR